MENTTRNTLIQLLNEDVKSAGFTKNPAYFAFDNTVEVTMSALHFMDCNYNLDELDKRFRNTSAAFEDYVISYRGVNYMRGHTVDDLPKLLCEVSNKIINTTLEEDAKGAKHYNLTVVDEAPSKALDEQLHEAFVKLSHTLFEVEFHYTKSDGETIAYRGGMTFTVV